MRRQLAYAAGAVVLALAGCGGDEPTPQVADPTMAPSASSSASESAAAKEPWEKNSDDGAIAFVEHWLDVFNAAETSGETSRLLEKSTSKCETCANFAQITSDIYAAGGYVDSEGWKVQDIGTPTTTTTETVVAFNVKQTPQSVRETASSQVLKRPGGQLSLSAHLVWRNGRWLMNRLDRVT